MEHTQENILFHFQIGKSLTNLEAVSFGTMDLRRVVSRLRKGYPIADKKEYANDKEFKRYFMAKCEQDILNSDIDEELKQRLLDIFRAGLYQPDPKGQYCLCPAK